MVSAHARREQVRFALTRGLSVRRACALFRVARSSFGYQRRMPARDVTLHQQLQAIAKKYPRYGYRRAWALLRREQVINIKRVHRVWAMTGLQLPRRRPRRRVGGRGLRPLTATAVNQVWAYDFVHDRCANGHKLKLLTIIDEWTRECLAIEVDGRITAARVIQVLQHLMQQQGAPRFIRSDNGPEFIAAAIKSWLVSSAN